MNRQTESAAQPAVPPHRRMGNFLCWAADEGDGVFVKKMPSSLTVEPHSGLLKLTPERNMATESHQETTGTSTFGPIPHSLRDRHPLFKPCSLSLSCLKPSMYIWSLVSINSTHGSITPLCACIFCLRLKWSKSNPVSPTPPTSFFHQRDFQTVSRWNVHPPFIFAGQWCCLNLSHLLKL